ncbi:trypsin-like peptidase domain-containing protein [Actinomadura xylanilytica]|uniref:trypsin-like peptidase domain-containing protein n=1 Tax=Actinomadura xylanilytica TaxID=887459 RepID=UPI00255B18C5|nr:trypsin-like peptidase domain-containing protein [Actinomadura xylanilytica]MDL4772101.1 trypsin-like peptidase domain-containing protein [Actinomadura xylanilytica]
MTEENRGPAKASSEDDDIVPGFGAERQGTAGSPETTAPPETVADREMPEPEEATPLGQEPPSREGGGQQYAQEGEDRGQHRQEPYGAEPGSGEPYGAKPYAAESYGAEPRGAESYGAEPYGAKPYGAEGPGSSDRLVAGGFAPPDGPTRDEIPQDTPAAGGPGMGRPGEGPLGMTAQEMPQQPVALDKYGPEGPEQRQRPGFVPHHQDPRAQQGSPYGWPPQQSQQPPPPGGRPMGPPPMGGGPMGPPPPGGPRPMGPPAGYGPPPGGGPNWAPVPALPSASRGGPGLGVLAVVALIVALVAGGVGAGVGVMATGDDDGGGVSLGGSDSGTGPAVKNRPPDSVAGVAQKVLPSVVMIQVESSNGQGTGGTGFIVNGGYVVTNNHVAAGAAAGGKIQLIFNDKQKLPATVKGRDPSSDVAVLKPEGTHSLPPLEVGNSDALAVGDPVIAIGSPLGLQGSVTTGIVSSLNRPVPTKGENGGDSSVLNAIQTDAAINPGNSGGPLVDGKGRVIGINTAIATLGGQSLGGEQQSGSIGLGFAIPINQAKRVAEEIIRTGSARRAQLGIGMDQRYQGPGVKIADRAMEGVQPLVKGGPAEQAGLKPGDVITKLGGKPIEDPSDLSAQISSRAPGQKVQLTYQRAGKETTVEITLGTAN